MRTRLVVACLCAAVVGGCGGHDGSPEGGGSPGGGGSAVSESQWRDRVNAICLDNDRAVKRVVADVRSSASNAREAAAEVLERSISTERDLLERLGAVQAPASIEPDYRRFVGRIEDALPLFHRLSRAIRAGRDDPDLETRFARIAADTRPFATRHGLTQCLPDAK